MPRLDLAFILCCCKACLVSNNSDEESFYELLGVDINSTQDEIKRAYKRQSLQMHPDKLAQKGQEVTEELQARFTRMKEAYEVLADPHKRESYDTIGEVGMKWIDEPFNIDPQQMAHNFTTSSTVDRSKIFGIFVALVIIIFILPILLCLKVDGIFGPDSRWTTLLTPLWIYDALALFYHARVIMMGPTPKPDYIPEEDWVDLLPIDKRVFSLFRFMLVMAFEILAVLRLDHIIEWKWYIIFIPIYVFEAAFFIKRFPAAQTEILTMEEVEYKFGKPFTDFTRDEKDMFLLKSKVAPSKISAEFAEAEILRSLAREDIIKVTFRAFFLILLLTRLDTGVNWNWWLVFIPFWLLAFSLCCFNLQTLKETNADVAEEEAKHDSNNTSNYGAREEGADVDEAAPPKEPLSEAEQAVLQGRVAQSASRFMSSCCTSFFALILLSMITSKAQGAKFSSIWIISPFLIVAAIILCLSGCAIFGVSPVDEDGNYHLDDPENPLGADFTVNEPESASYAPPITSPKPAATTNEVYSSPSTALSVEEIWAGKTKIVDPQILHNVALLKVPKKKPVTPQIDLLDEINPPLISSNNNVSVIEPTPSEVDDLD